MGAEQRYDYLSSYRQQFLDTAFRCSQLTLPYLVKREENNYKGGFETLVTPWQSVGAKGVTTLASKLMLALIPPNTSFFKLQLNEAKLGVEFPPEVIGELDSSFAKLERTIMESIAASADRVVIHQALKHLIVAGNVLLFMGKDGLKIYPLNRYVVDRDGNGNITEIVAKESISRKVLSGILKEPLEKEKSVNSPADEGNGRDDELDVYTHVTLKDGRYVWHQEVNGKRIPKTDGNAPTDTSPWLPLRFNVVDGECYGRGRVEEFLGDLNSLEALMQALVEGSAVAAKVVFLLNPGSTTKPATLAQAKNGAIVIGKTDDVTVVQVQKSMDFRTAQEMAAVLERRISEAFLVLNVRQSERTTAEEVRMTQMELDQQLGGNYSLLTVEFLLPYLKRKLAVAQRNGTIPPLPKGVVQPTIVAGINAIGRGQDAESLAQFFAIIQQTFGPEALLKLINPLEATKRFAAAKGIDTLNLVQTQQDLDAQKQQQMDDAKEMELVKQTAALASTPIADPTKNPQLQAQNQPTDGTTETNVPPPS